jgi:hypothetical protein
MAVESKPLFHPEVLRQQVRSFTLPEQTGAWQPKLQQWAGLIASGRADQLQETPLKSASSASGSRPPRGKRLTSLDHTIREGNSVISDPAVHPKAFGWQAALREVFAQDDLSNVAPAGCWSVRGQRGHPQRANP